MIIFWLRTQEEISLMELDDDEGGWARDPGRNKNFLRGGGVQGGQEALLWYISSLCIQTILFCIH